MRRYDKFQMEFMIAGARRQKQMIEELVSDLESKPRYEDEDVRYLEVVLEKVERNLKNLRKACADNRGFSIRFL